MKKRILTVAAMVVCLALLGAGTLAYFTDEVQVHNVITSGAVDIRVEEWQQEGDDWVPYPTDPVEIMPGTDLSKIVTVKNLDAKSWVRAKIDVVIKKGDDEMDLTEEQLDALLDINLNLGTAPGQWTDGGDGWYYYNTPVEKGEATEPLFKHVHFSGPNMTNEYQNCTVEVNVTAQATQFANNEERNEKSWPVENDQ